MKSWFLWTVLFRRGRRIFGNCKELWIGHDVKLMLLSYSCRPVSFLGSPLVNWNDIAHTSDLAKGSFNVLVSHSVARGVVKIIIAYDEICPCIKVSQCNPSPNHNIHMKSITLVLTINSTRFSGKEKK